MVKIPLIEDHALNRDTLVRQVTRHGFQGIELVKKEAPAIIQMNMSLPEVGHRPYGSCDAGRS